MAGSTVQLAGRWWRTPLAMALMLDILGAASFALAQVLIFSDSNRTPSEGFFDNPAPAILMLGVGLFWTAGGVVAALGLVREPLRSSTGRWAVRLLIVNITLIPVLGVITGVASVAGKSLPEGWGQPLMPIWLATGLAAVILGLVSRHERARGALVGPLLLGTAALTFMLGEVISQH